MYDMKALYQAESVQDAVALRVAHPDAQIIAGGSDVLVQMREGKRAGVELISIYGLDELRGVTLEADGTLRIGSLTSFSHITRDPLIQKYLHVLGEAVDQVGGPQIRNIGTIGGNTCNGVTSADSASTLHAYDAIVELTGPDGIRRQPIREFYIRAGKVDIRPGEIQTAILIEKDSYIDTFGLYKVCHAECHGHRHPGNLCERPPFRRQKDRGAGESGLRRGGAGAPAGGGCGGAGRRTAGEPGAGGSLCPGGEGGHQSPGLLAGGQGFPDAHRGGERPAGVHRSGEAGGR